MKRTALLLAVLSILGVACGSAGETPAGADTDTSVSSTPGDSAPSDGGPQRVEPRDGLVDDRATTFDRFRLRDGGRAVDLFFWSGIEECYGVDHVAVEYRKDVVKITLFEGRDPAAETCIELAVRKVVRVALDERVGGRRVVDGGGSEEG
jgi:hypothetical protein